MMSTNLVSWAIIVFLITYVVYSVLGLVRLFQFLLRNLDLDLDSPLFRPLLNNQSSEKKNFWTSGGLPRPSVVLLRRHMAKQVSEMSLVSWVKVGSFRLWAEPVCLLTLVWYFTLPRSIPSMDTEVDIFLSLPVWPHIVLVWPPVLILSYQPVLFHLY